PNQRQAGPKDDQKGPAPDAPQDAVARLRVLEVLKGNLAADSRISVQFSRSLVCPPPPHYVAGETTLVFLVHAGKDGPLRTCSLSYGTKIMDDPATRKAYLDATREIIRIAKIEDMFERDRQTVEWLVRCVETPSTRWDGAFDLEHGADERW